MRLQFKGIDSTENGRAHTQLRRIDEPKVIKLQCQKRNEKKEPSTRKIYVEQPPNGE